MEIFHADQDTCCPTSKVFGMELARERLRDVTVVIATAKATHCDHDGQAEATFPEYMDRLQEKKDALQEEVLKHLGLQWVAPTSPPRLQPSRSGDSVDSSRSHHVQQAVPSARKEVNHEDLRAQPRPEGAWVRPDDEHSPRRLSAYDDQAAAEPRSRCAPLVDARHRIQDDATAERIRGIASATHGPVDGWTSSRDHHSEETSRAGIFSWRKKLEPETMPLPLPLSRVTPPRVDETSVMTRASLTQERGATGRSPSPNVVQPLSVESGVPFALADGGSAGVGSKRSRDAMLMTPLPAPAATVRRWDGACTHEGRHLNARVLPEDFYSRRPSPPSLARTPSLEAAAAVTSPPSSESDQEDDPARRRVGRASLDLTTEAAEGVLGLQSMTGSGPVGRKRAWEIEQHEPLGNTGLESTRVAKIPNTGAVRVGGRASPRMPEAGPREQGRATAPPRGQACRDVGCHRRPIYAFKGDTKALCCPIHRSEEMVNVRHPLCRHESCFRQPSFGVEGDKRASFCSEHKLPEMINVSSRRCRAPTCLRHPNFGFQGDRRATYCCRHKAPGMVDVVSRRCKHPQCVRRPLYAMTGQRAMFCRTHKDPGMTDVVSRRCNFEEGCDRHPSFGWKQADGKARRCAHHRLEGMESVKVNRRGSLKSAASGK